MMKIITLIIYFSVAVVYYFILKKSNASDRHGALRRKVIELPVLYLYFYYAICYFVFYFGVKYVVIFFAIMEKNGNDFVYFHYRPIYFFLIPIGFTVLIATATLLMFELLKDVKIKNKKFSDKERSTLLKAPFLFYFLFGSIVFFVFMPVKFNEDIISFKILDKNGFGHFERNICDIKYISRNSDAYTVVFHDDLKLDFFIFNKNGDIISEYLKFDSEFIPRWMSRTAKALPYCKRKSPFR